MKHATLRNSSSRGLIGAIVLVATLGPVATLAQTAVAPQQVTPGDVAAAPVDDFNVRKQNYPPVLLQAQSHPYTLPGGGACPALNREVATLNAALGPDIDELATKSEREKRDEAAGGTARSVAGSLVPFGGVIRAISGANAEERRKARLLYAGSVRRAYIKGYAHARGCRIARYVAPPPEKKK